MNKAAITLWAAAILILTSGFYGFYIIAAGAVIAFIFMIVFYKPLLRRQWRREDLEYLDALFSFRNREEYERRRQKYINEYGRDPGSYDERLRYERQKLARIR